MSDRPEPNSPWTPEPLSPNAAFLSGADSAWSELTVADFWQWAYSDLVSNTDRGQLAEFIVARAIGAVDRTARGWLAYDLALADGTRVEVKSSAYLQSWKQTRPSRPRWDIGQARAWDPATDEFAEEPARNSDVYVFCLLTELDRARLNPLDLDQWIFYVVPTPRLDIELGAQKSVGLTTVARFSQAHVVSELREAVHPAEAWAALAVETQGRSSAVEFEVVRPA